MNNLSRHIESLLLTHNCVVVPQFGAFVTHENSASRAEAECLFFPPSRVVRFNPSVIEDDGLLVNLVRNQHRCRTTEAKRLVQTMVLNLRQQLLADGQVDFGSIGIFSQDEDGHVSFEPCQAGAVTPTFYGLDAFMMPKLTDLQRSENVAHRQRKEMEADEQDSEKHIIIRINRRSLRNAALAVAAILVCVFLVTPFELVPSQYTRKASVVPSTVSEQVAAPESVVPEKAVAPKVEKAPSEQPAVQQKTQAVAPLQDEPVAPQVVDNQEEYVVVLACNVGRKNATRYVEDLKSRGFENVRIHDNGKMLRVVLGGFATEGDAYNQKKALNQKGKEFADSWVMKL